MTSDFFEPDYFPSRASFPAVKTISREEFLDEFEDDYRPGQHLTAIGPTQRGKSRLTKEAAKRVISPALKLITLAGKPPHRELTWTDEAADELGLHITEEWPPPVTAHASNMWKGRGRPKNSSGYLLRPHHTMSNLEADLANLKDQFSKGMLHAYGSVKQKFIVLADEGHHVEIDLKLKPESEAILMRGAPDCAKWTNLQRGFWVSKLNYNMPEHILLFKDKSRAEQDRYAEIGGVDPRHLSHLIMNLRTKRAPTGGTYSQAVYFRRVADDIRIIDT